MRLNCAANYYIATEEKGDKMKRKEIESIICNSGHEPEFISDLLHDKLAMRYLARLGMGGVLKQ